MDSKRFFTKGWPYMYQFDKKPCISITFYDRLLYIIPFSFQRCDLFSVHSHSSDAAPPQKEYAFEVIDELFCNNCMSGLPVAVYFPIIIFELA